MKKWLIFLSIITTSIFGQMTDREPLEGFVTDPFFEIENAPPPFFPFSVSGDYIDVSRATLRTPGQRGKELRYRQWDIAYAYTHPFSPVYGLIFGAGWVGSEVSMQDNPEFKETIFNYVNFSVGGFTNAFNNWTWTLTLGIFLDSEVFSLLDYSLYQGVLWGKYNLCSALDFNCGLITEIGLNKEKIWPIFGFTFTPSPDWRLNAVYPINMSLEYDFLSCWTAAASIRLLRNRHRVQENEPNPRGIFEYHTWGGEFDLIFSPFDWFSIKGFAGSTADGDLKVTNRNDKHGTHFKFRGSFYTGANAILSF